MPTKKSYNQIAGQSLERLAAISDGVFAFAMTLLVLDLKTPVAEAIHSEGGLWQALVGLAPQILTWLMSFMTLGIFWNGQQAQLNYLKKSDRHLTWIHLGFLAVVSLVPFSTKLLSEFITLRTALLVYWLNILFLGSVLYAAWMYACHAKLFKAAMTPAIDEAVQKRIIVGQALYAFGATLCFFSTYWSIGFIVFVQLNYAIAPKFSPLSRV
jgi:uncharacterized membrane protein